MNAPPSDTPVSYSRSPTDPAPAPKMSLAAPGAARYRILEELGRGGIGRVLLAEDARLERRAVVTRATNRVGSRRHVRAQLG